MQQAHPGGPAPTGCACLCFLMMKQRIAVTILMYVCLSIDFSTLAVKLYSKGTSLIVPLPGGKDNTDRLGQNCFPR